MTKIFVDMDGTVANFFKEEKCLEKMFEENFFLNLEPLAFAEYINELATYEREVYILSACIDNEFCKKEKLEWLEENIPFVNEKNIILCMVGENKAEVIKAMGITIDKDCILYDDYTANLNDWEIAGGKGIKALNGINGKNGTWTGATIVAFE